jgi:hypothetical protein
MDWPEVNCILEALTALLEKHRLALQDTSLSEDDRSDLSNDLAYAETLLGKYEALRDQIASR